MSQAITLTESKLKIVLAVVENGRHSSRNRLLILLSHLAGMRVGEIAKVRISDVISEAGQVLDEIQLKPEQTKGAEARTVFIGDRLKREIANYLKKIKKIDHQQPLIYSQKTRGGFSANSLCQEFKKIYQKAGICGATSHSGRRTFITNLANKGISVRVLASLAGHKSISTTQVYIDVNDDMKRSAVNLL